MAGLGLLGTIIVGGLAGWLAGMLMDLRFGVFMNIIIGVIGAALASAVFERAGIWVEPGVWGGLVSGFIGACILLFLAKIVRR
ncbi:GlsB/YeaQ/YmgE family stress response membrane protein [Rhizobium oryzicola]|uniref:GlsB/YeaQ/YmgE family stress response membrane protein n=1 Tax=Rhizobium oryzicola TaxID=1232668 RepID=A0ABT8SZJ5_9HYPH|nr:GlsB/YeaQ/YmgE family stress response membrane protein [Rhizobium oryzicola]MDO1583905.1 GlsB/YeaQ/YmgE family stress response membrane protein [Rhizobium oryzicola]